MMRGLLAIAASLWLVGAPAALAQVTVLRAERVYVDFAKPPLTPGAVAVRGDRIIGVGPASAAPEALGVEPGEAVTAIDLGARTLMPGLIDAHVHLSSDPGRPFWQAAVQTNEYAALIGAKNARLTLAAGFTTVRDLGSGPQVMQALRDAVNAGLVEGPRILASGPAVSIIGGHADPSNAFNSIAGEAIAAAAANVCTGPIECAEAVRRASRAGVDVIKFTATGGVLSQQNRGLGAHFTQEEMNAIVETAHQLGLKVAAHAHGAEGVIKAVRAGVDSIDHGTFIDEAGAREMRARGTYLVPTFMPARQYMEASPSTYTPVVWAKIQERLAALGRNVQLARRFGVPIAFGTDAGVYPHGRNGEEFAMLVEHGGMAPRETLIAATTTAAQLLGLESQIGTIEPGKSADLIAVDADPLADVRVMERVRFVMARGRVFKQP